MRLKATILLALYRDSGVSLHETLGLAFSAYGARRTCGLEVGIDF